MCQAKLDAEVGGYCYSALTFVLIDLRTELNDIVFWLYNGDCEEAIINRILELGLKENEWYICQIYLLPIHYPSLMPSFGVV